MLFAEQKFHPILKPHLAKLLGCLPLAILPMIQRDAVDSIHKSPCVQLRRRGSSLAGLLDRR
jgi:hypothetical protein